MQSPLRDMDGPRWVVVIFLLGLLSNAVEARAQGRLVREYVYSGERLLATTGQASPAVAVGWYRPSTSQFFLHGRMESVPGQTTSIPAFAFGQAGDTPLAGDWNGDGIDTIGVYRPGNSTFYLRNSNTSGSAEVVVPFGTTGDMPVVGDWNADGVDTIGVYRPSNSTFYLRNANSPGNADHVVVFGQSGDLPVAGDWGFTPDGIDTVGVYRPSDGTFYLRDSHTSGPPNLHYVVTKPEPGTPVSGDWDRNGVDGVGLFVDRGAKGAQLFRLFNLDNKYYYAPIAFGGSFPGDLPVVGDFDGIP